MRVYHLSKDTPAKAYELAEMVIIAKNAKQLSDILAEDSYLKLKDMDGHNLSIYFTKLEDYTVTSVSDRTHLAKGTVVMYETGGSI